MYRDYRNQGQGPISLGVTFLDMFYNLPMMKQFRYRFLRNYESCKIETWYTHAQWADNRVYQDQGQGSIFLGVLQFLH